MKLFLVQFQETFKTRKSWIRIDLQIRIDTWSDLIDGSHTTDKSALSHRAQFGLQDTLECQHIFSISSRILELG